MPPTISKALLEKRKRQKLNKKASLKSKTSQPSSSTSEPGNLFNANNLKWKPVSIPDTLDDFEGFYGLEEIDGVDVKVVNGKVKFAVKDDDSEKLKDEEEMKMDENQLIADPFQVDEKGLAIKPSNEDDQEEAEESEPETQEEAQHEDTKSDEEEEPIDEEESVDFTKLNEAQLQEDDEEEDEEEALPPPTTELPKWSNAIPSLSPVSLYSLNALKFTAPTPIQSKTVSLAIEGKDVIGKAITGSGKTLAYGLPIFERALKTMNDKRGKKSKGPPNGIIFAPTRELANQVMKNLKSLIESSQEYSRLNPNSIASLTGGLSIQKQERMLRYDPRIIVATPGRFLELLEKSTELSVKLASTDIVVFDEADRLLQDGHFEELDKILEVFNKQRPRDQQQAKVGAIARRWQTLVFSATFSKELFGKLDKKPNGPDNKKKKPTDDTKEEQERKEVLELLTKKLKFRSKPEYIDVNPDQVVANKVTEALIPCGPTERDLFLYYFLLMFPGTTLVFTNSIDSVKRLQPMLQHLKIPTVSIHSSMIQKQRLRSLERFQQNSIKAAQENVSSVLIASDVAARGLDIPGINHVIHYHLPRSADVYVHRSGRTARAGSEGVSVILCSPQEASGPLRQLRKIVTKNDKVDEIRTLPLEMEIVSQLKERIEIAAKLADSEINSQSTNKESNWVKAAAEELGIEDLSDLEEDDFLKRDRKRKQGKQVNKQESGYLKAQLKQLLSHPIRKIGRTSYISSGLTNIAQLLISNEGNLNKSIMGHLQQDALDVLKGGKKFKGKDPEAVKKRIMEEKQQRKSEKRNRKNESRKNKRQKME